MKLTYQRAFKCDGGYAVYNAEDSHPTLCNVDTTGKDAIILYGTHNYGETWEVEGIWGRNRFDDFSLTWIDHIQDVINTTLNGG